MAALAPASLPTPFTKNRIPATTTLVLLQICRNFEEIRQVHAQLVVSGLLHCPPNAGKLLESYATLSHLDYALSIFNAMPCPDVFAYNTIIRGLTLGKDPYCSMLMYNQFLLDGLYPDNYTYTFVLKACSQLKAISEGKQVHCQIIKAGTPPDTYINSSLISMYMNSGNLSCAEHVLAEFSQENTLADNSIISGYLSQGFVERARTVFNNMAAKDVASWSAMLTGYTKNGFYAEALTIFQEMIVSQVCPNESTFVSSLSACAHMGALDQGRLIHAYINKIGAKITVKLGTALIDMYAKCGSIKCSYKTFRGMAHRDIVAWGAIISGFAMHGEACKCFELFDEMVAQGIQPNEVVFVAILSACRHAGCVELGHRYFYQMVHDFGITPSIEHYGCMVDLLGRAGHLAEAEEFILAMPEEPNSIIWGAMLSACRTYNGQKIGNLAFRHLTELEPMSGDRYKLAGLMFGYAGEKENATRIRKFIKENDLETTRGWSFIEVGCVITEFVSGKVDHGRGSEIHRMLETINRHLEIGRLKFDTHVLKLGNRKIPANWPMRPRQDKKKDV